MIKKFSFWVVILLLSFLGAMGFIHWNALREIHQKTSSIQPLYQRLKLLDAMTLSLERYRRMSASFRKLEPREVADVKENLRTSFSSGLSQLDRLESSPEERPLARNVGEEVEELLSTAAHVEPMLFSKDAYQKPEVVDIHNRILSHLSNLEKGTQGRISAIQIHSSRSDTQSVFLLIVVGCAIFLLFLSFLVRDYFFYVRPLRKVHRYAKEIRPGISMPEVSPLLTGQYAEIQSVIYHLATSVETYMRDRHKFILDIAADLRAPLNLLKSGKFLLSSQGETLSEKEQLDAAESVRKGLAIFSGSLDDLDDLVDYNRLESRLEETAIDISDLLSDVSRTLIGSDFEKKISMVVPPIPVWVSVDSKRLNRVLIQLVMKVMGTLSPEATMAVAVNQFSSQSTATFRGIEIMIQDAERMKTGRATVGGPEQDILKHWISESGFNMILAHKIIKAHGGTLTAAGVAGTSVSVIIRLPQERIINRGLISPPTKEAAGLRGLTSRSFR